MKMMCEECGKRPAILNVTVLFAGKKISRSLCPVCAAKMQRGDAAGAQSAVMGSLRTDESVRSLSCPKCGTTGEKLLKEGKVGCMECYKTFKTVLRDVLMNLNGTDHHVFDEQEEERQQTVTSEEIHLEVAQVTEKSEEEKKAALLREALFEAVQREDFEEAARLRDQIRAAESVKHEG